jgi:pimeloyl-ACP methyl ester carboxylesterase
MTGNMNMSGVRSSVAGIAHSSCCLAMMAAISSALTPVEAARGHTRMCRDGARPRRADPQTSRIDRMTSKRALGAVAASAVALGLASAAYQAAGEARDRRSKPPSGRLVDVGGYRLHIMCAGEGSPAVVIIPALGGSVREWLDVQQRLAQETAVCVYDRAGLGWSDSPPRHRAARRMAEELHALVRDAGVAPPYVVAGHSLGGLIARVFARLYPEEVAGLALIEATHPEIQTRLTPFHITHYRGGTLPYVAFERLRPLGLQRLAQDLGLRKAGDIDWASQRRAGESELLAVRAICRDTAGAGWRSWGSPAGGSDRKDARASRPDTRPLLRMGHPAKGAGCIVREQHAHLRRARGAPPGPG